MTTKGKDVKYRGVIQDAQDGETYSIEIAAQRDGPIAQRPSVSPGEGLVVDSHVAEALASGTAKPREMDESYPPEEIDGDVETPLTEAPPQRLSGRYAALRDALGGGIPSRQVLSEKYAALRDNVLRPARARLVEGAGQFRDAVSIATEEYTGGKRRPKQTPKPKPKPMDPRMAELTDKYQRIKALLTNQPPPPPPVVQAPRRRRRRPKLKSPPRAPRLRITNKGR